MARTSTRTVSNNARLVRILETIKELTGHMTRSHHDLRHCARCGKALTDPASWERGIGPECARKDTALYAKTIPQAPMMVFANVAAVNPSNLPEEVREVWADLKEIVNGKILRMCENSESVGATVAGEDCRLIAKIIDWMLSFRTSPEEKNYLINVVKYMGFIGLAGVLAGKASTGESKLGFENGRVTLVGSSNKQGFLAMRRIPGITLPKYRGSKTPFTAPAKEFQKFLDVALEFWPMFEGEIPTIKAQCEQWIAANPERVEAKAEYNNKPVANISHRSEDFSLKFQWVRGVSERLVNELKGQIPPSDRKYDPATYTWFFKKSHLDKVLALFEGAYVVESKQTSDATPAAFYNASANRGGYTPRYNYRSGAGYRHNWSRG